MSDQPGDRCTTPCIACMTDESHDPQPATCPGCQHKSHAPGVECEAGVDHGLKRWHRCLCLSQAPSNTACHPLMDCQGGHFGYSDIWHLQRGRTLSSANGPVTPDVLTTHKLPAVPSAPAATDPELTAEEARGLADDLGLQLYRAQDALAFVEECCVIADREGRTATTADVREWLKGARCGRRLAADANLENPVAECKSGAATLNSPATTGLRGLTPVEIANHVGRAIWALKTPSPTGSEHYCSGWDDGLDAATDAARDAVLAALPAHADRAAVLRKAADVLGAWEPPSDEGWTYSQRARYEDGVEDAAEKLRRMADECPQCGDAGACNGGLCPLLAPADQRSIRDVMGPADGQQKTRLLAHLYANTTPVAAPADAAVLREAADMIYAEFTGPDLDRYARYGADYLRRKADEAPQRRPDGVYSDPMADRLTEDRGIMLDALADAVLHLVPQADRPAVLHAAADQAAAQQSWIADLLRKHADGAEGEQWQAPEPTPEEAAEADRTLEQRMAEAKAREAG